MIDITTCIQVARYKLHVGMRNAQRSCMITIMDINLNLNILILQKERNSKPKCL